eukprot:CAMPEP_0174252644 /NCGR_PEP_ID=MMETSP0439-20130205/2023_1 /TAXON_ID=0 /ORGANISM="Stereomyxa ramosa, Strain Chinc5" /LENGTH=2477 /DNA_ID=CAMNT_0015333213 /DNA_START=52 /DNA_END=7482 /DNA_ORIENTATION=+
MSLQLKIVFSTTGVTKSMRFTQMMSVSETLKEIKDKTGEGGRDHGLMRPADPVTGRTARWLDPERTLQFYDIHAGETLELRKKHRPLKFKLMDDTVKTMLIDDSLPVNAIVEHIGEKMGLRNPEEFSLRRENPENQKKKRLGRKSEAKMWLHPTQALCEQGVSEDQVLLLKKKFYVDDANVDRSDPVQLHLVYVQSHEAVVNGEHTLTKQDALNFGALQLQIAYGTFDPNKHDKAFIKSKMSELVPKQYARKVKPTELMTEWKKIVNMVEVNAKYRYVQAVRSLKSYGITYYDVRWKPINRRRLEPVRLGITRDNIVVTDLTGAVKEDRPLIHLKRWAAADNSFTLDFGDYRDEYMSLQTEEGTAISQQLAGYIDILLKRRKDGGVVVEEEQGERAMVEEVATLAGLSSTSQTTQGFGGNYGAGAQTGQLGPAAQIPGISPGLSAMMGQVASLGDADSALLNLMEELMQPLPIGQHGALTPEQLRQELSKYNKMLAQAAGVLIRDASSGATRQQLDAHAPGLAMNLAQLIGAAKQAAAASGGDISLLDGARACVEALRQLMGASGDLADNPNDPAYTEALSTAATMLQVTSAALQATACGALADDASRLLLLEAARVVAAATNDLLANSQSVASNCPAPENIHKAQRIVARGNNKVSITANAVAPTISDGMCQKYMVAACKGLNDGSAYLVQSAEPYAQNPVDRSNLAGAAKMVSEALQMLVNSCMCVSSKEDEARENMAAAAFMIQDAVAQVMASEGNQELIVSSGRAVQQATAQLVQDAKSVAAIVKDPAEKSRLLQGCGAITKATKAMLGAAAPAAKQPNNKELHDDLKAEAARVSEATREILGDMSTKEAAIAALRTACKGSAGATFGLVATVKDNANSLEADVAQQLLSAGNSAAHVNADLVGAVKDSYQNPKSDKAVQALVVAATSAAKPSSALIAQVSSNVPKFADTERQKVKADASEAGEALKQMLSALKVVKEADGLTEVDEAMDDFDAASAALDYACISAEGGSFEAIPGQTRDGAMQLLDMTTGQLKGSSDEVVDSAQVSPQALGPPAKETAANLAKVIEAAKAVASTTDSKPAQMRILNSTKGVTACVKKLINAGRSVACSPNDPQLNSNLRQAHAEVYDAINQLLSAAENAGAGSAECDQACDDITNNISELLSGFAATDSDLQDLSDELVSSIKALNSATSQVVDCARHSPKALGPAARLTSSTMPPILKTTNAVASKVGDLSPQILTAGRTLAADVKDLLQSAKGVASSPQDRSKSQQMSNMHRQTKQDAENLLRVVDSAIPGKRELLQAHDMIKEATSRLNKPSMQSDNPQFHLQEVNDAAKILADSVGRIVASARSFPEKLGPYGIAAAQAVSDICDASKDASSGDPAAVILLSSNHLVEGSKQAVSEPDDPSQVLNGAKDVARDCSTLLDHVKKAAVDEGDAGKRRQLIMDAEKAAIATNALANAAKDAASGKPNAVNKLLQCQTNLENYAKAVAQYKSKGRYFGGLLDAARLLALETGNMIEVLKVVAGKPKDSAAQTQLALAAKSTTDLIRRIIKEAEELTYGHKECKKTVEDIQAAIAELDVIGINATIGLLPQPPPGSNSQDTKEELISLSRDLAKVTGSLVNAAKSSPENLGPSALDCSSVMPKLVSCSQILASTTSDMDTVNHHLNLTKNVATSMLGLVGSAQRTSMNPTNKEVLKDMAEDARNVSDAITDLVSELKGGVEGLRACDEALQSISDALYHLGNSPNVPQSTYVAAGDKLTREARDLVSVIANHLIESAKKDPSNVGKASKLVASAIPKLIEAANGTVGCSNESEVKKNLLTKTRQAVMVAKDCVGGAKAVAADPKNSEAISMLSSLQTDVTRAIGELMTAVREGATLEREADIAVSKIQGAMSSLDSASLFAAATAGNLEVELPPGATLDTTQQQLTSISQRLLKSIGNVNSNTHGAGQEKLGACFRDLASDVCDIAESTKQVASLMGDLVAQQDVLTAAKAVTIASQSLVLASKASATRSSDADAKSKLQESHASCANAVKEFIRVSEDASAEAVRGIRQLHTAEKEITTQLQNYKNPNWPGMRGSKPVDVVKAARIIASSSGHVVSTCTNDTEGLVSAAKNSAAGVCELLASAKAAVTLTDDPQVERGLSKAVIATGETMLVLLNAAKTAKDTPESQQNMSSLSEDVADRIMEVVGAARRLPGGAGLRLEEGSGDDLESVAERELMKAAKMIEEAAKRLLAARPSKASETGVLDEAAINAAILDGARAITVATAALVQAATIAQRERIAKSQDPTKKHFYRKDPTWAQGLISAAKAVGGTTQDLVSAANGFVQKEEEYDEEYLIASAKQVAAATARLMAASRAKSDPFSDSHKKLSEASKAVATATQKLVEAARMAGQAVIEDEEDVTTFEDLGAVQARKVQLRAQAEMLRLEKALEEAQRTYMNINKEQYSGAGLGKVSTVQTKFIQPSPPKGLPPGVSPA